MHAERPVLHFRAKNSSRARRPGAGGSRPRLEHLEDRTAPAAFLVSNTLDSGSGSLRQAILDANAAAGADTITFALGSGVQTISPSTRLPSITDPVTIDGTTEP